MDLKAAFTNPWVIGGGLALGAFLLLSKGSAAPDAGTASAFNAMNAGVAQNYATSTAARVALGSKAYETSATVAGFFSSTLSNLANIQGVLSQGMTESNNGAIASAVNANAAVAIDISRNSARLGAVGQQTSGAVTMNASQGQASQNIAKASATANMWASIAGSVAKLGGDVANAAIR